MSSQANLDVSGMGKYKLILTGMDTPMINEGEATPLYYGGFVVPGYEETAHNYSVVYRFNVTGFTGTKVTVEFNDRTNPGFIPDPDAGIYAIACVDGEETKYETLLQPKYAGFDTVMDVDIDTGTSSFTIEIVISSMSTLPATVIFE